VFVAALAARTAERNHRYHERLRDFADQTEQLLMTVVLVLFGGTLAGGLLAPFTWAGAGARCRSSSSSGRRRGSLRSWGSPHSPRSERTARFLLRILSQ
jgi:hypothetical protein